MGDQKTNQDVFFADGFISTSQIVEQQKYSNSHDTTKNLHVFAVCDGIGMYNKSGLAAEIALDKIKEKYYESSMENSEFNAENLYMWVKETISLAKDSVLSFCKKECIKSSTTIVLLAIVNDNYILANVGDSPAFLIKDNEIRELSLRQNMATFKELLGVMPVPGEEHILLHHLGEKHLTIEINTGKIDGDSTFVLCSDGIMNAFTQDELLDRVTSKNVAFDLVSYAGNTPKSDNCTAILVHVKYT